MLVAAYTITRIGTPPVVPGCLLVQPVQSPHPCPPHNLLQDHLLRNWVSISAFLLFVKKAGLQQQEAALKWLLRQLQLTYPAFCMWQRWPPAQLMAGSDKAAATQAGDTAAAASYTTYCTINKFLQHPDSMQRLLELAGQEDVLSLIQSCAKLPASCCDTGGAGSSSRCERGPEAAPRGGQGMESSSSSSSIHAPAVAAPVQSLYAHMADTMFRSVLAAWDRLRLLLLDPQQWVVDAVERPTEQLTDSCGVHSSSSSSSSRCTGSRADEARTAALGDGSGADESRLCDSSSSSAPKSGLTALVPVWGYGTQPLTADGKPYVVNAAAVRACVAASLQLPTYTADGVSPWQAAVQLGDPRLLEALLSCPSNLIAELRQQWQQALEHAADQFQIAALRLLLQTGAAVMSKEVHAVWSGAIQKGEEQVALALMEAGIDVNGPCGEEGDTALLALARARSTWGLDPDQVRAACVSYVCASMALPATGRAIACRCTSSRQTVTLHSGRPGYSLCVNIMPCYWQACRPGYSLCVIWCLLLPSPASTHLYSLIYRASIPPSSGALCTAGPSWRCGMPKASPHCCQR